MAVKIVEDSAVLTLDFWDKETIYNGQVFPVGTLPPHRNEEIPNRREAVGDLCWI